MKTIVKFTAAVLCLVFLLSFAACGPESPGKTGENEAEGTGLYLVKDGKSDYGILLPEAPYGHEEEAAKTLAEYFLKATDISLPVLYEGGDLPAEKTKFLSVGPTKLADKNGIKAPENVYGQRGFLIKEKDGNVFLLGGRSTGTLYAVCGFLHETLHYEPYSFDEFALDTGVRELELTGFDICSVPDIPNIQNICDDYGAGYRMRYNSWPDIFYSGRGPWHNTFYVIPPSKYNDPEKPDTYHPKWFTSNENQLHYTAHGDADELKVLQDEVFEKLKAQIEEDFQKGHFFEYIGFMQQDAWTNGAWPKSDRPFEHEGRDSVSVLKEKYGNAYPAAMQIRFINPIADRLKAYMDEKWDGREMNITIFAYQDTEKAPVKLKDGAYMPMDGSVKLRPNVNVLLAPIFKDYIRDFEENGLPELFGAWQALSSRLSFWFYNYYYGNPMIYFDSAYSWQPLFQAVRDVKGEYVFVESAAGAGYYGKPFADLRVYLISKLAFFADIDVNKLVDDYFTHYFKDAAGHMREYFELLRTHTAYLKSHGQLQGLVFTDRPDNPSYWPEGILKQLLDISGKAYDDIRHLKTEDPELYGKLDRRITLERLTLKYLLLWNHSKSVYPDDGDFKEAVAAFRTDCEKTGIGYWGSADMRVDEITPEAFPR